jgi:hypothetical protein
MKFSFRFDIENYSLSDWLNIGCLCVVLKLCWNQSQNVLYDKIADILYTLLNKLKLKSNKRYKDITKLTCDIYKTNLGSYSRESVNLFLSMYICVSINWFKWNNAAAIKFRIINIDIISVLHNISKPCWRFYCVR